MYSTWRSGESTGYCDLHRRGLWPATLSADVRRVEECEPLGERPTKEGAGDSRGRPFVLGFVDRVSFDGRYGSVDAMIESREGCSVSGGERHVFTLKICLEPYRKPITDPRVKRRFRGQKKGNLHSGGDRR